MPDAPAPLSFSVGDTLRGSWLTLRRAPAATLGVALLLALPIIPTLLAMHGVLGHGGASALQGAIAGAPRDAADAIVLRPQGRDLWSLVALAALAVIALGWFVVAGATVGAVRVAARRVSPWRVWPAVALAALTQLLVLGVLVAAVFAVASVAARLQFQLTTPVAAIGLVPVVAIAVRLSLWPAIALRDGVGALRATGRAWRESRGHVLRLTEAAGSVVASVAVPALAIAAGFRLVLVPLALQLQWTTVAPATADLWALVPFAIALPIAATLWGLVASELLVAMRRGDSAEQSARSEAAAAAPRRPATDPLGSSPSA